MTLSVPRSRRGFTLIELLVVIAIIAILAAILFPVFKSVGDATRKAKCGENMKSIYQALKMYQADWKQYPDALYGVSYNSGPLGTRLSSSDYVRDPETFTCPSALPQNRKNMTLVNPIDKMTGAAAKDVLGRTMSFPAMDSYDFGYQPNTLTGAAILHYNRTWTGANQGLTADARQLIRKDPPADTVVTWCLNHADFDAAGNPKPGSRALVLFLSGRVKDTDAAFLTGWPGSDGKYPWQVQP